MWWYILIAVAFVIILVLKLAHYYTRKSFIVHLKAKDRFKSFFKMTYVKMSDNRKVIYYSNGPTNIHYDPTNLNMYKTGLIEVPYYVLSDKKKKLFGKGWLVLYSIFLIIFAVAFLLSLAIIICDWIDPNILSFANNYDWLVEAKKYVGNFYFCEGALALTLLAIFFIVFNVSYRHLFFNFIPYYLQMINGEIYYKTMQPIYIKLD